LVYPKVQQFIAQHNVTTTTALNTPKTTVARKKVSASRAPTSVRARTLASPKPARKKA
jgi:uncharacterized protein YjaZ